MRLLNYFKKTEILKFKELFIGIIIGTLGILGLEYYSIVTNYEIITIGQNSKKLREGNVVNRLCSKSNANFLNRVYPVGSIFMSTSLTTTTQVADALGGTWEAYSQGRVLIGIGSNGTTNYNTITTGGTESQSYTPAGKNSGMAVTMNQVGALSHSGGAVVENSLTVAQLPKITGTITMHNTGNGSGHEDYTFIYSTSGYITGRNATTNLYSKSATLAVNGAQSIGLINMSFGSGNKHGHSFTQPSNHAAFTPTVKTYTNPTFTGTAATISHMQPYATVYMYKRIS